MSDHEAAAPQASKYKTGPDKPPKPAPVVERKRAAIGWEPMETAPKNGIYVYLEGDPGNEKEVANEWFWHATRQFRKGVWQATGWWRLRFGPNCPPSFSPSGWRNVKEGLPK